MSLFTLKSWKTILMTVQKSNVLIFSGRIVFYTLIERLFNWFFFHIYPVLFKSRYVILKSFLPTYFYFPCPSFLLSNITEKRWLKVLLIEAMHKRKYYVFCILTLYRYYCVHISSRLLSHKLLIFSLLSFKQICLFWGQIICLVACYLFTCLLNKNNILEFELYTKIFVNICITLSLYLKVKCGCNEQCSSWIVQRENTKRGGEITDLYKILGHDHVSWRSNHSLLTGHTRWELFVVIGKTGNP